MQLNQIELTNYRNYNQLTLNFSPKLNVFVGDNAQGKTNLLESIYVLSLTKSHRSNHEKELIQWDKDFARIEGQISKKNGDIDLTMIVSNKGKKTKVNGLEQTKLSQYIGYLNVILFAPEDLSLVKGSPQYRRKFLDMEIGQINSQYLHHLSNYQTVLKQRNQYLKKTAFNKSYDSLYLDVLNEQLAQEGSFVLFSRLYFIKLLEKWANSIHENISYGKEELRVSYKSTLELSAEQTREELYHLLMEELKKTEERDLTQLTTNVGPHRDDLVFMVNGQNVQTYGSQGQQRTTALSVKLAEIELINEEIGEYPILLLDDVLSELDDERQVQLMEFIDNKLQTFLTTTSVTHLNDKLKIKPEIFYVTNGEVERTSEDVDG
ncbi:DNA replication/repair protein RecF [Vagococcus bubulae]|uniref:DNA replication and repair protein RecF n=1 Tax=Vagococcus bubulae TaxID=1977868 RepID=A0A429ZCK9_9ENTE|nr:DNA replication/repair protein RecF [Vagococcus bubulae]RST91420.1 DNA replication/repair protein RecF [Vagococcus bubulae]